ncbi:hypothetical protein SAMN04488061_3551 [Filomicrobium insigne]|uniref:Sulfotransferase domain-containing protein n=1 Tax=Filomicrobium insigne TaxID=418854 RepID=A0A1H0UAC2_9HYPH|nr:sulfotransferase [Filomicrobium insigne]SDP63217.1 hypothetical protein SAMN04488061_3551 [Filomicrobium insigne]
MKYLVHIGYPKAASTWLQTHVFSGVVPAICPLRNSGRKDRAYAKSGGELFYDRDAFGTFVNVFQFNSTGIRAQIESRTDECAPVTVLSNEGWCGHPFAGGVTGKAFAERIHAALPEATILIVVRNQPDMIVSIYLHFLTQEGGNLTLHEFIRPVKWVHRPSFALSHLSYMNLIHCYDGLFGRDRVVVVPFELIKRSPEAFVKPIFEAVDVPVPEALPTGAENARNIKHAVAINLIPRLNSGHPVVQSAFGAAAKFLPERFAKRRRAEMINYLQGELGDYYKASNRELQARMKCDLKSLGYLV